MRRPLSTLGPALLLAAGVIATAALRSAAPREPWSALAAPLLLVLMLVAADLLQAHLEGGPTRVSSGALILGVAILLAGGAIAAQDLALLGGWIPVLGACAIVPLVLRRGKGPQCSLD